MLKISVTAFNFMQNFAGAIVSKIKSFSMEESGATAVEYSLIVALIGIVIAAAAKVLGTDITNLFKEASCAVSGGAWNATSNTCTP